MATLLFGIVALFALNLVSFPCEAKITPPPNGTRMTFLPGSTAVLKWTYDNSSFPESSKYVWIFSRNGNKTEILASIQFGQVNISENSLPGVAVEKPATLILSNIDLSYNGTYHFAIVSFSFLTGLSIRSSGVVVYIAVKPTVTLGCSSPITVNEGDAVVCECKGEGGNPPADVTWFKDNAKIGKTGKEEQVLALSNVGGNDDGTYMCKAQSHVDATDRRSIGVNVRLNFKPRATSMALVPAEPAILGGPVILMCKSDGFPEPSYTIIHNGSTVVSNDKTYVISKVNWSDSGPYRCFANNKLGGDSNTHYLKVVGYSIPEVPVANYKKLFTAKPNETSLALTPAPAILGGPVILICESNGFPKPSYTIFHNGSDVVSSKKTYVISKVNWSDSGSYRCVAENKLGSDSGSYFLTIVGQTRPQVDVVNNGKCNASINSGNIAASEKVANDNSGRIVIWPIAVSLVSGIIIGIPISYVVWRFCRRRKRIKNRNPERNPNGQQKMADAIYQELDLPTIKTGSSAYHSMANASSMYETVSDPESTYTELRKIRDPENVYQSLF